MNIKTIFLCCTVQTIISYKVYVSEPEKLEVGCEVSSEDGAWQCTLTKDTGVAQIYQCARTSDAKGLLERVLTKYTKYPKEAERENEDDRIYHVGRDDIDKRIVDKIEQNCQSTGAISGISASFMNIYQRSNDNKSLILLNSSEEADSNEENFKVLLDGNFDANCPRKKFCRNGKECVSPILKEYFFTCTY
eukprot:TRINITY_DN24690_c0_g1_i1.p1 TRINITY_DN24690_c0_g1~~TRINITY_DN24690_c0_g1_i1.p1  ORF type:complete len:203 (+),score=23.72 TRINITY_DN24690_c0_g1_i1:38-610(+)